MNKRKVVCKWLDNIVPKPTAHGIGLKRMLLTKEETVSNITQISKTSLAAGESIEMHVHPTMDEHYFFEYGNGEMTIDGIRYECRPGLFLLIPAGIEHNLLAITDIKFLTIGIAI